jgi:hypothetical protein
MGEGHASEILGRPCLSISLTEIIRIAIVLATPERPLPGETMKTLAVRISFAFALPLTFLIAFTGLTGCNSNGVQASGGSNPHPTAAEMSGPPTYNQRFAARNPRVCAKVTTPPTPEQAKALVQCGDESIVEGLYASDTLVTDLQVEMGQPTGYNSQVTHGAAVDPNAVTYALRGQGTKWVCSLAATGPGSAEKPAGQNCMRSPAVPKGKGLCERNSFGEWECSMTTGNGAWDNGVKGPTEY